MIIGIIASGAPYAGVIAIFSAITFYSVQHFHLRAYRQLRWLDLKAAAPLLTHVVETSKGITHVRAFSWQADFLWQFYGLLDYAQKPRYYMLVIRQWVVFIMDLSICIIAVILVCLALAFHGVLPITAIGIAMANLTTLNPILQDFMSSWGDLDGALVAISSTKAFNSSTPSESEIGKLPAAELPDSWPLRGEISLSSVSARYK
jgi:ABC-type bacteriocin/lantibiotic exporter with double-glycine peptidase domain